MHRRTVLTALGMGAVFGGSGVLARMHTDGSGTRMDWPEFAGDPSNSGWNPDAGPSEGRLAWQFQGRSARTGESEWRNRLDVPPVVADGTVFVGAGRDPGTIYAVDGTTGEQRWSTRYDREEFERSVGERVVGAPAVEHGTVYVGTEHWRVHAFDATDGEREWTTSLDGPEPDRPLTVVDGTVFVVAGDDVFALDARDGKTRWRLELGAEATEGPEPFDPWTTAPAVADGRFFVARGRRLYSVDANHGDDVGVITLSDDPHEPIQTAPVVAGGLVVLVTGNDDRLVAVDRRNGTVRWSAEVAGDRIVGRPAVADGRVTVGTATPMPEPVPVEAGEKRGDATTAHERETTTPATLDGTVSENDGRRTSGVETFDLRTGRRDWRVDGLQVTNPPVVGDGTVYVVDRSDVVALDATDGRREWRFEGLGNVRHPALAGDRLYVTSGKAVYAIA